MVILKMAKIFNLCLDIWSQPGISHSYLGITAQCFNKEVKKIEACRSMKQPQTGVAIKRLLESVMQEWGLHDLMVIQYVTKEGSNIVAGLRPYTILHPIPRGNQELKTMMNSKPI